MSYIVFTGMLHGGLGTQQHQVGHGLLHEHELQAGTIDGL